MLPPSISGCPDSWRPIPGTHLFVHCLGSAVECGNNLSRDLGHIVLFVEVRSAMAKDVDHRRNQCGEQMDLLVHGSVMVDFIARDNTLAKLA